MQKERDEMFAGVLPDRWRHVVTPSMLMRLPFPYLVDPVHEVLWRRITRQEIGSDTILTFFPLRPEDV